MARSLALFGMMSVHIFPAFREDGSMHPSYVLAAGRAAALFAVLAGVGLALMTGGRTPYDGARLRAARAGVLARAVLLLALVLLLPLAVVALMPLILLQRYRAGSARRLARPWIASLNLVLMSGEELVIRGLKAKDVPRAYWIIVQLASKKS